MGVETIASSISEDKRTVENLLNLIYSVWVIKKTTKGRLLTQKALQHLKIKGAQLEIVQNKDSLIKDCLYQTLFTDLAELWLRAPMAAPVEWLFSATAKVPPVAAVD